MFLHERALRIYPLEHNCLPLEIGQPVRLPRDVSQGERRRGLADFGEGLQGQKAERDGQTRRGKKTIGSCFHNGYDPEVNARLTGAPAQPRGNPQSRFQSRPLGFHDLAKFFADSAAGLIVPSVIGWIADFLRLAWSLLDWNTRKTLWPRRGRGGRAPCQDPSDSGQKSVSSVATHTPDACWPGAGWTAVPDPVKSDTPLVGARTLAPAEYRFFLSGGRPQHVWFWHLFDGRPTTFADPYNLVELFGLAWRYGFRRDGDQLFVRVASNRPWAEFTAEPFLAETFSRLQPLGP